MTEQKIDIDLASVPIRDEDGLQHVRLEDIPASVRPAFDKFIDGKTTAILNDGTTGVFAWDWTAFLRRART